METTHALHVRCPRDHVRQTLARALCAHFAEPVKTAAMHGGRTAPGDVVVMTCDSGAVERCADLTRHDVRVILVAAIPSEEEEAAFRRAGAEGYLPMSLDLHPLLDAVAAALASPLTTDH